MNQSLFEKNYLLLNDEEHSTTRKGIRCAPGRSFIIPVDAYDSGVQHRKSRQSLIEPPLTAQKNKTPPLKKIYPSPTRTMQAEKKESAQKPHDYMVCSPPRNIESQTGRSLVESRFSTFTAEQKDLFSTNNTTISLRKTI